jgi:thiamine pyrophosphokinase
MYSITTSERQLLPLNECCAVVLGLADHLPPIREADYIGADRGALFLFEQGIHMTAAIGDFDSVTEAQRQMIAGDCDEMIVLRKDKDNSDSEAAVDEAVRRGYQTIFLIGALGGRLDHAYVNLCLTMKYPGRVILIDDQNRCQCLKEGVYPIRREGYRYVSLFAQSECEISLKGFLYPLDHRLLAKTDLYGLSNELTEEAGEITVHRGTVLVIQAKD